MTDLMNLRLQIAEIEKEYYKEGMKIRAATIRIRVLEDELIRLTLVHDKLSDKEWSSIADGEE